MTSVLALSVTQAPAAPRSPENSWQIENATVSAIPFVSQFVGGQWVQRTPAPDATLLELRGTLKVAGDGSFGPLSLADVGLLSGGSGVPATAELVAVGVGSVACKYLPAKIADGSPTELRVGAGREFVLLRDAGTGPVSLRTRAPSLDLCMAFELPGTPPPGLLWRIADRPIALIAGSLAPIPATERTPGGAPEAFRSPTPASAAEPHSGAGAIWPILAWGAAALAMTALVGGSAALWMRRRRENGAGIRVSPGMPTAQMSQPQQTSQPPTAPLASPAPPRSDSAPVPTIPRVTPSHQPTIFARVEADGGPGQQLFREALSALRLGNWTRANELFAEAIARGLAPTFETGAWGLRGEASLRCRDLVGAMTCFLRALSCPAVTTESAVLSASHLAAIYRQLRLRRDARKMDKLKAAASPFGGELSQDRIDLIDSLTAEFRRKRRALLFARLIPSRGNR